MKRLNIKGWEREVQSLDGKRFELQYGVDKESGYHLSFKSIKTDKYYQMSISKDVRDDDKYQVWIWSIGPNVSYPLSIDLDEMISKDKFTRFLDSITDILDTGGFNGEAGNRIKQL